MTEGWGYHLSLPVWLPNGRLLFAMREAGVTSDGDLLHSTQIVSAQGDGSDLSVVKDLGRINGRPRSLLLSPDGNRLAFLITYNYGNDDLHVMNADGTGLVHLDTGRIDGVTWTPDGSLLTAHYPGPDSSGGRIYTVDPKTGAKTQLN